MPFDAPVSVLAVHVGRPRTIIDPAETTGKSRTWQTSFFRTPVEGRVEVGPGSLAGDEVTDKKYHGSPDQALLFYAAAHYPVWREELGIEGMGPGGFGENLTVEGVTEEEICLGDRLRVGTALFEVTSPRFPCWKIDRRWSRKGITARVMETGRCGWYVRVFETGSLANGDAVELLERPAPEATLARAARAGFGPEPFAEAARIILACDAPMDPGLKKAIQGRLK